MPNEQLFQARPSSEHSGDILDGGVRLHGVFLTGCYSQFCMSLIPGEDWGPRGVILRWSVVILPLQPHLLPPYYYTLAGFLLPPLGEYFFTGASWGEVAEEI